MSQPPMDDDFQDRIQRILNDKKKEDLRKQYGMSFEGHSEEMSPGQEGEWLDYITEFERQFENARQITVGKRIGDPEVKPLAEITDAELADELDRLFDLFAENNIAIDFLHEQTDREMYRFITEELLEEETDDIQIPGMVSHFIYEEFHPNDEDDITDAIEEFLFTLFNGDFKDPQGMHDHILSEESMHDSLGNLIHREEFKLLLVDFYEAYPLLTGHEVEIINIRVDGDQAVAGARIMWHGRPKSEQVVVDKEGLSEFRLARSLYGGWDITQANIPGWVFQANK
jgi:hypothetical protein